MARQFRSVVSGPGSVNRFLIPANVEDTTPPLPTTDLRATKNVAQETILKRRNMGGGDGSHETDPSPSFPSSPSTPSISTTSATSVQTVPAFEGGGLPLTGTDNPVLEAIAAAEKVNAAVGAVPGVVNTIGSFFVGQGLYEAANAQARKAGVREVSRTQDFFQSDFITSPAQIVGGRIQQRVLDERRTSISGTGGSRSAAQPKVTVESLDDLTKKKAAVRRSAQDMLRSGLLREGKEEWVAENLRSMNKTLAVEKAAAVAAAAAKADPQVPADDPKKGQPPVSIPVWRGSASPTSVNGRSGDTGSFDEDEGSPGGGGSQQAGTFDDPSEDFDQD